MKHFSSVPISAVFAASVLFLSGCASLGVEESEEFVLEPAVEDTSGPSSSPQNLLIAGRQPTLFDKIFSLIENYYLYDVDIEKCQYDILKGLSGRTLPYEDTQARDTSKEEFVCLDKFSGFVTPKEYRDMSVSSSGRFAGIGTRIKQDGDNVVVVNTFDGGPAEEAGIISGDMLLRAREENDTEFTEIEGLEHAVTLLRGVSGSTVVVVVGREGRQITVSLTRGFVNVPSVISTELPGDIGYVWIRSFTGRTGDELEDALARFLDNGDSPRVIIDVRNDPGGALVGVLETLYLFSRNPDDILLTERGKNSSVTQSIYSLSHCQTRELGVTTPCFIYPETGEGKTPGRFANYWVIVLVNKSSASASEIFSGTLQDWGSSYKNFIVIGETTYGKGVVQSVIPLGVGENTPAFKLTVSEYLVGNGKEPVHGIGVHPDYYVPDSRKARVDTLTSKDREFRAALRIWDVEDDPAMLEFLSKEHFDKNGDLVE